MIVQVEASLYPLGTTEIGEAIEMFINRLERPGLNMVQGTMSTRVEGNLGAVFPALSEAFECVAAKYAVVLSIKISNACPSPQNMESKFPSHHNAEKEPNKHGS